MAAVIAKMPLLVLFIHLHLSEPGFSNLSGFHYFWHLIIEISLHTAAIESHCSLKKDFY